MKPKASGPAALIPLIDADRTFLVKAAFTDIGAHDAPDNMARVVSRRYAGWPGLAFRSVACGRVSPGLLTIC